MESKKTLTSAVMLETQWATRRNDILELITPFVEYCVAKITSPGEQIDLQKVVAGMHSDFGYVDIPESVIKRVFSRHAACFRREHGNYYLVNALDDVVTRFEQRQKECEDIIESVGESLYQYLKLHCRREKIFSKDTALRQLHNFFAYFGIDISVDRLKIDEMSRKSSEIFYYIARYIVEKRDEGAPEYKKILSLVKGYYLETALYLQPDNGNLMSANYKNVTFYYDTPFLLQLLGYQSEQEEQKATRLHGMLRAQGANFRFFPQTKEEIINILTAYGYSLNSHIVSRRTLEGLDQKHYNNSDVDRLKAGFQEKLRMKFGIELTELPAYPTKADGSVEERFVVSEQSVADYVRSKIPKYKAGSLQADIDSGIAIHKLRRGHYCRNIEECKHLFVTTNIDFVNAFNSYYRKEVQKDTFDMTIDTGMLSAITWVKCSNIDADIPELQLLENAYSAQQPLPELIEKMVEVLVKMESEGKISYEEAVSIRTARFTKKELLLEAHGQPDNVTDTFVQQICDGYKEQLVAQAKRDTAAELHASYQSEEAARQAEMRHNAERAAREAADEAKAKYITPRKWIVRILSIAFCVLGIGGCLVSISWGQAISWKSALSFIITLMSAVSVYDTVEPRHKWITMWIEKRATSKADEVYDRELKKYLDVLPKAKC